jgi:hypothetical protein
MACRDHPARASTENEQWFSLLRVSEVLGECSQTRQLKKKGEKKKNQLLFWKQAL